MLGVMRSVCTVHVTEMEETGNVGPEMADEISETKNFGI